MLTDVLDHTSQHDQNTKAKLLAKIFDKEGTEFGQTPSVCQQKNQKGG